jgi:hypothetical protein
VAKDGESGGLVAAAQPSAPRCEPGLFAARGVPALWLFLDLPPRGRRDRVGTWPGIVGDAGVACVGPGTDAGARRTNALGSRLGRRLSTAGTVRSAAPSSASAVTIVLLRMMRFPYARVGSPPVVLGDIAGSGAWPQKFGSPHFPSLANISTWREYPGRALVPWIANA